MSPIFYHSGEIGDLIYSLKVIKSIGKGNLFCNSDLRVDFDPSCEQIVYPNKPFDYRMFGFVKKLIEHQPYIDKFEYGIPDHIDYNLNYFRKVIFSKPRVSFADIYYNVCNVVIDNNDGYIPWIECNANPRASISVIRTNGENRTIPGYPWKCIVGKYQEQMIFLGTKSEYESFTLEAGGKKIKWFESADMLEICEVIQGAKLHMGNSTSISACAEAMKKNMIFEESCNRYDNPEEWGFERSNRVNIYANELDVDLIMEKIELFIT